MDWFGSVDLNQPAFEDFHPGGGSNGTDGQVDGPHTTTGDRQGAYASSAGPSDGSGSGAGTLAGPSAGPSATAETTQSGRRSAGSSARRTTGSSMKTGVTL